MVLSLSILPVLSGGAIIHTFFYRAMPFCPLFFFGFGVLFDRLFKFVSSIFSKRGRADAIVRIIMLAALAFWLSSAYFKQIKNIAKGIETSIDIFCAESIEDTQAVIDFLNKTCDNDRFVIASPMVTHALKGQAAIPPVVAKFQENKTDKTKYVHDWHLKRAQHFVVSRLFYVHDLEYVPGCLEMAWEIESQRWPLVWQRGEYQVYANPRGAISPNSSKGYYRIGVNKFYKRLAKKQ